MHKKPISAINTRGRKKALKTPKPQAPAANGPRLPEAEIIDYFVAMVDRATALVEHKVSVKDLISLIPEDLRNDLYQVIHDFMMCAAEQLVKGGHIE